MYWHPAGCSCWQWLSPCTEKHLHQAKERQHFSSPYGDFACVFGLIYHFKWHIFSWLLERSGWSGNSVWLFYHKATDESFLPSWFSPWSMKLYNHHLIPFTEPQSSLLDIINNVFFMFSTFLFWRLIICPLHFRMPCLHTFPTAQQKPESLSRVQLYSTLLGLSMLLQLSWNSF